MLVVGCYTIHSKKFQVFVCFSVWNDLLKMFLPSQCPLNYPFLFISNRFKQPGLELQKVQHHLGLKHVTISNFANKIFAYENIATTLHNHISVYYTDVILFSDFIR